MAGALQYPRYPECAHRLAVLVSQNSRHRADELFCRTVLRDLSREIPVSNSGLISFSPLCHCSFHFSWGDSVQDMNGRFALRYSIVSLLVVLSFCAAHADVTGAISGTVR